MPVDLLPEGSDINGPIVCADSVDPIDESSHRPLNAAISSHLDEVAPLAPSICPVGPKGPDAGRGVWCLGSGNVELRTINVPAPTSISADSRVRCRVQRREDRKAEGHAAQLATTGERRSVGGTGVPTGWSSGTTDSVIALA